MSGITTTKEDQYLLISIDSTKTSNSTMDQIFSAIVSEMEQGGNNFILDFGKVKQVDPALYVKLDEMNQVVVKENGLMIVTALNAGNEELLKELDIISIPTLNEARDYIFMEEIEKHFLADDEQMPDEAGIE